MTNGAVVGPPNASTFEEVDFDIIDEALALATNSHVKQLLARISFLLRLWYDV